MPVEALPSRQTARVAVVMTAAAAIVGALAAAEPRLAVGLVAGCLLLALPFAAPVAHLLLLVLVTAIVPFGVQNAVAFGGGPGTPGILPSDVLLLGGLARAGLVLLDTPLERRPRLALAAVAAVLAATTVQLLHGLRAGYDPGSTGAEFRVLLGFGAAAIALPILADRAQREALFKGLVGVGLLVGLWGLVQWTVDLPFTGAEDAGVREGVRLTSAGRGQIQGGLFAFPVAIVLATAALLSDEARSARTRALLGLVVALNAADLVLTYERTFWMATVLALAVLGLRASRTQRLRLVGTAAALLAVVVASMAVAAPGDLTAARERLLSIGEYQSDLSLRYRFTESQNVLAAIEERPLTGSGLGAAIVWGRAVRAGHADGGDLRPQRLSVAGLEARPAGGRPARAADRPRDHLAPAARLDGGGGDARGSAGVAAVAVGREHHVPRVRDPRDHGGDGTPHRAVLRPPGGDVVTSRLLVAGLVALGLASAGVAAAQRERLDAARARTTRAPGLQLHVLVAATNTRARVPRRRCGGSPRPGRTRSP